MPALRVQRFWAYNLGSVSRFLNLGFGVSGLRVKGLRVYG